MPGPGLAWLSPGAGKKHKCRFCVGETARYKKACHFTRTGRCFRPSGAMLRLHSSGSSGFVGVLKGRIFVLQTRCSVRPGRLRAARRLSGLARLVAACRPGSCPHSLHLCTTGVIFCTTMSSLGHFGLSARPGSSQLVGPARLVGAARRSSSARPGSSQSSSARLVAARRPGPGPARHSLSARLSPSFDQFVYYRSDFLYYRDESGPFGLVGARRRSPARRSSSARLLLTFDQFRVLQE